MTAVRRQHSGARAKKNKTARCTVFALADFIWPVYHDGTAQVADLDHTTFCDEDVCGLPSGTVIVAQPVQVCELPNVHVLRLEAGRLP